MSTLSRLLRQVTELDPTLGSDLARHVEALRRDVPFGLHFERHRPESVRLFGQKVMAGDKVHVLPPRGKSTVTANPALWHVASITGKTANLIRDRAHGEPVEQTTQVEDLVVVAEFRDDIYPGLIQTGEVVNDADDGLFHTVINGENYHALKALTYTHAGKVDAIYIDPPYNTRDRDWKYNNDYVDSDDAYRHSKWLAMMERRLEIAKQLLDPDDSVLIVTIDEKEYLRLGMLLDQIFPEARIQMVSSFINPAAQARGGAFARSDEYLYFVYIGDAAPSRMPLDREWVSAKGRTHTGQARWDLLRRSGTAATRRDSPGGFYPIYVDGETLGIVKVGEPIPTGSSTPQPGPQGSTALLPIRRDGSEGRWQVSPSTLRSYIDQGRVRIGGSSKKGFVVYYLKPGEWKKVQSGEYKVTGRAPAGHVMLEGSDTGTAMATAIPTTQWKISSHDATQYGSRLISALIPGRRFDFPKSLYAVEDALRFFIKDKPDAVVLDFFAGSGTTAHAVMRLNKQDGGWRQCISVTNNEVGDAERDLIKEQLRPGDLEWEALGICDYITKPRITAAITGKTPQGEPVRGDYKFTDNFPMSEGFEANARFFTLTYERDDVVNQNLAFERIAPLLWMRAGSVGRVISEIPDKGWEVAESYAILFDLDQENAFVDAVEAADGIRAVFVVTNDQYNYQQVAKRFPGHLDKAMLYRSYLTNFRISNSE